jgi:hypothetical protein
MADPARRAYLFLAAPCPACGPDGQLRFWRCSGGRLIVACAECWAAYPSPDRVTANAVLDVHPGPAFRIPALGCDMGGPDAGWATAAEVAACGWGMWVGGSGAGPA